MQGWPLSACYNIASHQISWPNEVKLILCNVYVSLCNVEELKDAELFVCFFNHISACCVYWQPHGGDICGKVWRWATIWQNLMKLHLIYCCFRQTTGTVRALLCHKHNNPLELKAWCLSRWSPGCRRKAGCTWLSSFCWWQSGKQKNVTLSLQSLKY